MYEKDCLGDFIARSGFGVGTMPLVASPRPSLWRLSQLPFKMTGLLNSQLPFYKFDKYWKNAQSSFNPVRLFLAGFFLANFCKTIHGWLNWVFGGNMKSSVIVVHQT
jgi:hypothetical protein